MRRVAADICTSALFFVVIVTLFGVVMLGIFGAIFVMEFLTAQGPIIGFSAWIGGGALISALLYWAAASLSAENRGGA